MQDSYNQPKFVWIAIGYAAVIVFVLYPAVHEGLRLKLLFWNCISPTLGLLVAAIAFNKSKSRMIVSVTFALVTATITTFFSAASFVIRLDLDPYSATTKLVFVFAPVFSLGLATIVAVFAWFIAQIGNSATTILERKERPQTS
jgi:hypothetical protein